MQETIDSRYDQKDTRLKWFDRSAKEAKSIFRLTGALKQMVNHLPNGLKRIDIDRIKLHGKYEYRDEEDTQLEHQYLPAVYIDRHSPAGVLSPIKRILINEHKPMVTARARFIDEGDECIGSRILQVHGLGTEETYDIKTGQVVLNVKIEVKCWIDPFLHDLDWIGLDRYQMLESELAKTQLLAKTKLNPNEFGYVSKPMLSGIEMDTQRWEDYIARFDGDKYHYAKQWVDAYREWSDFLRNYATTWCGISALLGRRLYGTGHRGTTIVLNTHNSMTLAYRVNLINAINRKRIYTSDHVDTYL